MIEISSIFITLLSLFIFSNFPLNYFYLEKRVSIVKYNFNDILLLNILINCNLLLIFSFFQTNLNLIFIFVIFYSLFLFFIFRKNYLKLIRNNFYFIFTFVIIFYGISILIVKNAYLEYDALAHWIYKVKVFYQGGTIANLKGLPYDYYPHLGSYVWAFFWKNSIIQYEYLGRLFFLYLFLVSIFSVRSKLNNNFTELEKNIIIFLICFLSTNIFLFGGYQEYFLFFCFYSFSHFFIKFFISSNYIHKNFFPEIIILLIVNIFIWVKQEGLFYFFILSFLFIIHSKRSLLNRFFYIISSIILFMFFLMVKNYYFGALEFNDEIINSETFKNLQISYLLNKIVIITKYFVITFFKYPIWILIFLSILFLKQKSNFLSDKKFIFTFFFLMFGFVYAIFLNTPHDLSWLVPITLNRLVFAMSGFLIFLCVEMLNNLKK